MGARPRQGILPPDEASPRWFNAGHPRELTSLLQRIRVKVRNFYAVPGCRIWTSSLRKSDLFHASSTQPPRETIVSFDAARLVINSVLLVVLLDELLFGGP